MDGTIVTMSDRLRKLADEFRDTLKPHDQEHFAATSREQMQRDINHIQSQQDQTRTTIKMNRIGMFLDGLYELEKVLLAVNIREAGEFMAYVWGSVRFLLQRTKPTEKVFDNVLDVYEQLGAKLLPLSQYTRFCLEFPKAEECLVNIYRDVQRFHSMAYKLFSLRPKLWQRLHRPIWKDSSGEFKQIVKSLGFHAIFIDKYGATLRENIADLDGPGHDRVDSGFLSSRDWREVAGAFDFYLRDLNAAWRHFEEEEVKRKRMQKLKVRRWISSSSDMWNVHWEFRQMRVCPNSGRWLFRRYGEISDWMKEEEPLKPTIWLHGNRAFGKTILASLVVDELQSLKKQKNNCLVPDDSKTYFFYCQGHYYHRRTYVDILRGILDQIVALDDYLLPVCDDKMTQGGGDNSVDTETAQNLIEAFVEYNPRQYIIIDGLDECENAEIHQTAAFFMHLVTMCNEDIKQGQLRVMFVSRPMPDMKRYLSEDDACIALKPTDNASDIRAFVRKSIPEFSRRGFILSEADKEQLEIKICHQSTNMLFTRLAIEYLLETRTKSDLLGQEVLSERLLEMFVPQSRSHSEYDMTIDQIPPLVP